MGEVVRFPGAQVDHELLDNFAWTDELLREYAARARFLADRYGKSSPLISLPRWPRGRCQDCRQAPAGRIARRYRVSRYLLCSTCAASSAPCSTLEAATSLGPMRRAAPAAPSYGRSPHERRRAVPQRPARERLGHVPARDPVMGRRRSAVRSASLHSFEQGEAQRSAARAPSNPLDDRVPLDLGDLEGRDSHLGFRTSLRRGQGRG